MQPRMIVPKVMAVILAIVVTASCEKIKCDEPAPSLAYDTLMLDNSRENLIFQTEFEDCQGDIGHSGDVIDSNTIRSVRTFLFEKVDSEWQRWYPDNLSDTIAFFSVIPASDKNREGWLLKGTVVQSFPLVQLYQGNDTIRLETYIIDQAGNRSNRVQSVPFIFQNGSVN